MNSADDHGRSEEEIRGERQQLLPSGGTGDAQPLMQAGAVRKLQCLICMLVIIVVGLVASLSEASEYSQTDMTKHHQDVSQHPWYLAGTPTVWINWVIKCAQLSMAIGAYVYLERRVLRPGEIPRASFHNAASLQRPFTVVQNVPYYLELPKSLASYPSKLFVSMFVIFAVLSGICGLGETVCFFIEAASSTMVGENYELNSFFEVLRCLLLTVFICVQTAFFIRHNRACIQWKLNGVWLAVCLIIATNISAWFFYVEEEIFESMEARGNISESATLRTPMDSSNGSFSTPKLWKYLDRSLGQIFSPFLIEFFIMGAILAGGFLANAGLLARALQQQQQQICGSCGTVHITPEPGSTCPQLNSEPKPRGGYFKQHWRGLLFSGTLVFTALFGSVGLKQLVPDLVSEIWSTKLFLSYTQSALYLSGIVCSAVLLRQLSCKEDSERHQTESRGHVADRLLLLCGALAVGMNDGYRLWSCLAGLAGHCTDWPTELSTAAVTLSNICQSALQVYLLECILVHRFLPRRSALLTVLLLLNAAEWLVSAVAFTILFDASHQETISLVLAVCTMPLQVFFRFHSIACIHEFKKQHCTEGPQSGSV